MKQQYTPNFPEMMRLNETNYAQLRRLIPKEEVEGAALTYQVNGIHYQVVIEESTRYTTRVLIKQVAPVVSYWQLPSMSVRLYHDAMVAEVCSTQQIYRFKARYDYPNRKLHQRDEKHQINQFLSEWLRYCLVQGVMATPLPEM